MARYQVTVMNDCDELEFKVVKADNIKTAWEKGFDLVNNQDYDIETLDVEEVTEEIDEDFLAGFMAYENITDESEFWDFIINCHDCDSINNAIEFIYHCNAYYPTMNDYMRWHVEECDNSIYEVIRAVEFDLIECSDNFGLTPNGGIIEFSVV